MSRSLLASFATVRASAMPYSKVRFCDNGPNSINQRGVDRRYSMTQPEFSDRSLGNPGCLKTVSRKTVKYRQPCRQPQRLGHLWMGFLALQSSLSKLVVQLAWGGLEPERG